MMMSIAKLRVGAEAYQLTGVAQSLDVYYTGAGEAAGWWAGLGADRLGLDGEVDGDDLRAVLAGIEPGTGGLSPNGETIRPHPRRVPGFDLTFKTPKSVSVLYAVSDDPRVQGAIIEAGEHAVRQTLAWLEREVMAVRRGTGNQRYLADLAKRDPAEAAAAAVHTVRGGELAAAVFRHRTSRDGDPLLHWHVLVPNLVCGPDGRWSAFVHPELFRAQLAAGEVFRAALREELTVALGIDWHPGRHVPEVAGVPRSVCDAFSKRSADIQAWLEAHGRGQDPASRQAAVLATRRGKAELEGQRFDTEWKLEGTALGFGPEQADALLAGLTPTSERTGLDDVWRLPEVSHEPDGTPYVYDRTVPVEVWIDDLVANDLLTGDATFTRPQLYQAVAARLGGGATIATIDRIAARVLASDQIVPIDDGAATPRWSTTRMLATERRLLDHFTQRDTRRPVDPQAIAAVCDAQPGLGPDQRHAVEDLTASSDPVSVLIGPAGTGKTHTLAVVRETFEVAGFNLVGAAPSARAAVELESDAGIRSWTLHSLRRRWGVTEDRPTPRTVLVVDEAAMASTGDLEPLLARVLDVGGRVILVGDHHQLPEVGPGGALAAAIENARSVAELTINRRQREPWEQAALAHLRDGSVPAAVDAYRTHDRVVVVDDHREMIGAAVDRYLTALDDGRRPVLMAGTNDIVRQLNTEVRRRLTDQGHLDTTGNDMASAGRPLVPGERVVLRRNKLIRQPADDRHTAVRNAETATVLRGDAGGIVIQRDRDGATLHVPDWYLDEGWVDYGYAVTAHRAQGGTWDLAIAVGVDGLYREAAYVQLSRGRDTNWLVIPRTQMDQIDTELERHDHGIPLPSEEPPETFDDLIDRLESSRAKLMALARDPGADTVRDLADTTPYPELRAAALGARHAAQTARQRLGIDPDTLGAAIDRAQHTALHVRVGQTVRPLDRQNIGTVTGINDTDATIEVHFLADNGRHATKTFPWWELDIIERQLPPPRQLAEHTQQHLNEFINAAADILDRWHDDLHRAGISPRDAQHLDRAADLLTDRTANQLTAAPPDWLTAMLGPRPDATHEAHLWDTTVRTIAERRLEVSLPDHIDGLGPRPAAEPACSAFDALSQQAFEARTVIDNADLSRAARFPTRRTRTKLQSRLAELDDILASAPDDQRDLVTRLTDPHQLLFEDTASALNDALATQGHRREWILAHWPHVIEHVHVQQALATGQHMPDSILDQLAEHRTSPHLQRAIDAGEAWIDRVLGHANPHSDQVEDLARDLTAIAQYRSDWGVTETEPFGPTPRHTAQASAYRYLLEELSIDVTRTPLQTERPAPTEVRQGDLDLGVGL